MAAEAGFVYHCDPGSQAWATAKKRLPCPSSMVLKGASGRSKRRLRFRQSNLWCCPRVYLLLRSQFDQCATFCLTCVKYVKLHDFLRGHGCKVPLVQPKLEKQVKMREIVFAFSSIFPTFTHCRQLESIEANW